MGYIIVLVVLIAVVPLLFALLGRRSRSAGGVAEGQRDRGVTVERPSSDQPTPRADALNQSDEASRRLPPG